MAPGTIFGGTIFGGILDEVLAVGDARFLDRCHARLDNFRGGGTTLLLISHSSKTVLDYCQRCVWLERGVMKADGPAAQVLKQYEAEMHAAQPAPEPAPEPVAVAAGD